jgi:hypothetical protein
MEKGHTPAKFGVRDIVEISMGQKKFKKPKPLPSKKPPSLPIPPGGIIPGFPEFWQRSHNAFPRFFEATEHLIPLVNDILQKPVSDQLPRLLHYMTAIISNSLGSLIILSLNGYGHDAIRVSRGMFETSVNGAYLAKNPTEVEDFVDYHWINQRKLLDYLREDDPALFQQLNQTDIDDIDREYAKVVPRFSNKKGDVRRNWCAKNLRQRAESVGMGKLYPTFYGFASSIHHGDFSGLASQISAGKFVAHVAPSLFGVKDALLMGHQSVLVIISNFNGVGKFGFDTEIQKACDFFQNAWDR